MDTTLILPEQLRAAVDEAVAAAVGDRWASRIWARDTSLWTDDDAVAASISDRLGWLDAPTSFADEVAELSAFAGSIAAEGFTDALVCGMGGSSIAAEVLKGVYPDSDKGLKVHVLDSTDPAAVRACDEALDPARTLRIIATKSGTTIETLAFLAHHWEAEVHRVGRIPINKAGNAFVAISDPGEPLGRIPQSDHFRETFLNPADIGGRYSALTYVGLVPAALLWLDLDPLLEDARIMADSTRHDADDNPALVLGAAMAALAKAGRDKLTFVIEPDLAALGTWLEQLIAESTGKNGVGIVPVDGEPLTGPGAYGDDRVFVRLGPANDTAWHQDVDQSLAALVDAGHPIIDIRLDEASWVGAEFFRWQFATAVAGIGLGVDPFDEPNVDESKRATRSLLEDHDRRGGRSEETPDATQGSLRGWGPGGGDLVNLLREHLAATPEAGYLHVGAYFAATEPRTAALRGLQTKLRDATGKASTLGYGPRFLHSTGQLHKGGPATGSFIQLTARHPADLAIAGRDESFGDLIDAQAAGDLASLRAHHLPVLRIDLGDDVDAGLDELHTVLADVLADASRR